MSLSFHFLLSRIHFRMSCYVTSLSLHFLLTPVHFLMSRIVMSSFHFLLSENHFHMTCHEMLCCYHLISVITNSFHHVVLCRYDFIACYHPFTSSCHAITISFPNYYHFIFQCHVTFISFPVITNSFNHVISCNVMASHYRLM